MPAKLVLTKEQIAGIVADYQSGTTLRQMENAYPYERRTLSRILKEAGVKINDNTVNSRRYSHNDDFFETIDTENKAYWLGFIYADGFIESKRTHGNQKLGITISQCDEAHLDKFKRDIESTNPIKLYIGSGYNEDGEYVKILITGQKTVDDLKRLGVHENKTYSLTFPDETMVPKHLVPHFIRGYFDGDGSLSYHERPGYNGRREYVLGFTGAFGVLQKIIDFFGKSELKIAPSKEAYQVNICGNNQLRSFLGTLYEDATVYLDRKYDKYLDYLKYDESRG